MERQVRPLFAIAETSSYLDGFSFKRPTRRAARDARTAGFRARARSAWKSTADPVAAVLMCIALAPLFLLIAAIVWRQSGRPIFYGQKRWGRNGEVFTCWKFRTMSPDAEARLQDVLANCPAARAEWEQFAKLKHDPRVTPIGRILRRTSLDELPQLWNVVVGDMSLVGARPIALGEEQRWGDQFRHYREERPGITGPWQIKYRNSEDYRRRLVLQRHYLATWTPFADLACLVRTLAVPFGGTNAY